MVIDEQLLNMVSALAESFFPFAVWYGEPSYIPMVRWDFFVAHVSELIERAERIKEDYEMNDSYELHLGVNK